MLTMFSSKLATHHWRNYWQVNWKSEISTLFGFPSTMNNYKIIKFQWKPQHFFFHWIREQKKNHQYFNAEINNQKNNSCNNQKRICLWCKTSIINQIFIYTFNVFPISIIIIIIKKVSMYSVIYWFECFFPMRALSHKKKMLSFMPIKLYQISASIDICTHDNISHWISQFSLVVFYEFWLSIPLLFGFLESSPQKWFCYIIWWCIELAHLENWIFLCRNKID